MCSLIVLRQAWPFDVAIGMNRDEQVNRRFRGPRWDERGEVFAPRDLAAGGTWIGLNRLGLFVAVSNRYQPRPDTKARSRGLLVNEALRSRSVEELVAYVQEEVEEHPYNHFNVLALAQQGGVALQFDGRLTRLKLPKDDFPFTNRGVTNRGEAKATRLRILLKETAGVEPFSRLRMILRDHTPYERGRSICLHGPRVRTVASALVGIRFRDQARTIFAFRRGPPCQGPFTANVLRPA